MKPRARHILGVVLVAVALALFTPARAQNIPSAMRVSLAASALSVDLDQCANLTTPCSWQNGDLNGNNSAYAEGHVVPFRLAVEGLSAGTHSIHINYDFTASGHEAYDFLATYDATETVDLCASGGGGVSSLCPSLPAPDVQAFPSDPFVVPGTLGSLSVAGAEAFGGLSRNLTLFGGTIISITPAGGPVHAGSTGGNSTGDFVVTFNAAGSAVLLAWGGHLAESAYWINSDGSPDGSGQVSGAPWHMRTQNLDNAGNKNQDRSIQPGALQAPTPTPTNTPTDTPTPTPTDTPTATPTNTPTATSTPAGQACTPGFWKNHTDLWPAPYAPDQTVVSVFAEASIYPGSIKNATLLEALEFGGGPGVDGAARILLRAGVAALLNAASGISYPLTAQQVIDSVNAALASQDRDTMLALASTLDEDNNLFCPLPGPAPSAAVSQAASNAAANPVLAFFQLLFERLSALMTRWKLAAHLSAIRTSR